MSDFDEQQKRKLIERYVSGHATEEEMQALFSLISNDELEHLIEEEMDAEIVRLRQEDMKRGIIRNVHWWIYAAAASIVAVLIVGLYFSSSLHTGEKTMPTNGEVLSGTNKAILTLADGRKINLDDASNKDIVSENGILIRKNDRGQLIYEIHNAKDSELETKAIHNKVTYNSISIPLGGHYQVILPDGSKVWMNAGSSLTYPSVFRGDSRVVEMTGEAYFEVAKKWKVDNAGMKNHKGKPLPFVVKVRNQQIEVLGTSFNVNAYPEEKKITTTLVEGSVRLRVEGSAQEVLLSPGEQGTMFENTLTKEKANTAQATAWKNGDFIFDGQDLRATMRQIARWYDVEVIYKNAPEGLMIGGDVSRSNNLSVVLQAIELTGKVKFKIDGKTVTVSQ